MGFGSKKKNYDTEIALLNERQNELSEKTDKNNSEVTALGIDFADFKTSVITQFNDVLDEYKHAISEISELKKWKEEFERENKETKKAKTTLPDTLTCEEICQSLPGFTYIKCN